MIAASPQSSFFARLARPRIVVPAIVAAGAIAAVLAVALPRHASPQRSAVSRYIVGVDGVQGQMAYALAQVMSAYRSFAVARSVSPRTEQQLRGAERTLAALESGIASLDAPPQAARLRALTLRLVREETSVTHEVDGIARFVPRFRAAIASLQQSANVLARRLAAAHGPTPHALHGTPAQIEQAQAQFDADATAAAAAQADAVTAYDDAVLRVIHRLRGLSAPTVFAPAYESQLASLRATYTAGGRLAAELRKPKRTRVPQLSRAFAAASRISQTTAEQRAEIAAIKAYNARVRAVGSVAAAIRAELTRLQQQLP